jgi:hypothetical protein
MSLIITVDYKGLDSDIQFKCDFNNVTK